MSESPPLDKCPIWGTLATAEPITGANRTVTSLRAGGRYWIADEAIAMLEGSDNKVKKQISLWIWKVNFEKNINASTLKGKLPAIYPSTIDEKMKLPIPIISDLADNVLIYLLHHSDGEYGKRLGSVIYALAGPHVSGGENFKQTLLAASFCLNDHDLGGLLRSLAEEGYLEESPSGDTVFIQLTSAGRQTAEEAGNDSESDEDDDWEPLPVERGSARLAVAIEALTETITAIRQDNGYAAKMPDEQKAVLSELEAGKTALEQQENVFKIQIRNLVIFLKKATETFINSTIVGAKIVGVLNALKKIWDWIPF